MSEIGVSEARAILPELIARVLDGEEVTLTRHGEPVAVLIRPDALRIRRTSEASAAADLLREELRQARDKPLPRRGISPAKAERRVRELRAERDRRR